VTENLYAVASGMQGLGESVVVGGVGGAISSGNLFRSWTNRVSGTLLSLYGVGYGNDRYVAVGVMGGLAAIVGLIACLTGFPISSDALPRTTERTAGGSRAKRKVLTESSGQTGTRRGGQ
jgi:hypothetical protein